MYDFVAYATVNKHTNTFLNFSCTTVFAITQFNFKTLQKVSGFSLGYNYMNSRNKKWGTKQYFTAINMYCSKLHTQGKYKRFVILF